MVETLQSIILLVLKASVGCDIGRTTLQKLLYLINEAMPSLGITGYYPHYYGPYNPDITSTVESLIMHSCVREEHFMYDNYTFYGYSLTKKGNDLIKKLLEDKDGKYREINDIVKYDEIKHIVRICKDICNLKSSPLSFASKVYFMLKHDKKDSISNDELCKKADYFGWDISNDDIDNGGKILSQLKLVTT